MNKEEAELHDHLQLHEWLYFRSTGYIDGRWCSCGRVQICEGGVWKNAKLFDQELVDLDAIKKYAITFNGGLLGGDVYDKRGGTST